MRFLVDVNLPPRLCRWLTSRGQEALHLSDRDLLRATDSEIWQLAGAEASVVVSKDGDFYDRALLFGAPPQVLHIDVGNCTNTLLLEVLGLAWPEIEKALLTGTRLVTCSKHGIEIFP